MYQQRPTISDLMFKQGCKMTCAGLLFFLAFCALIIGIIFYVALKRAAVNVGSGMLIGAAIMTVLGLVLCYIMHNAATNTLAEMPEPTPPSTEPLVSGCAPPGAISGFHIEARQQQSAAHGHAPHHQQYRQESGPARSVPSAPEELPPSYHDVIKTY